MPDWYVIAYEEGETLKRFRVVAGPLTQGAAVQEAQLRVLRKADNITVAIVEFDPLFGLIDA